MKKTILTSIILLFICQGFSQVKEGAIKKNNVLIDGFYGFPNFSGILFRQVLKGQDLIKVKTFGPIGGKAEFMLGDVVGVGAHVNYAMTELSGKFFEFAGDSFPWIDGTYFVFKNDSGFSFRLRNTRLRIMPTVNFHFAKIKNFDPYFQVALGFKTSSLTLDIKDPFFDLPRFHIGWLDKLKFPVTGRFELGAHYYIEDHFGFNLAFGAPGGAIVQAGISTKF